MDPLSTVANAISVVQAIIAAKKLVDLIKEIPEVQNQYEEFTNELVVLEYMIKNASPLLVPHPVIGIVEKQMENLLNDLRDIEKKCTRDSGSGKGLKAKKHRWLLEGNEIQRLRERASRVKQDLSVVLGLEQQSAICNDREEKIIFQKRLDQFMTQQESMLQSLVKDRTQTTDSGRIEELPDDAQVDDDKSSTIKSTACQKSLGALIYQPVDAPPSRKMVHSDLTIWNGITPMTLSGCSENCQCHCHFRRPPQNGQSWMQSLFGSWNLSCRRSSSGISRPCIQNCKGNSRGGSLKFQARPPVWLGREWPELNISLSLRPRKIISLESGILKYTSKSADLISQYMKGGFDIFPDEETASGKGLVEIAMHFGGFDFLEVLLKVVWKNLLPRQRLPKNVFYAANHYLENQKLNDRETNLLLLAKSWADDDWVEERRTNLYSALLQGRSVETEVKIHPWAVDVLDYTGLAPIHLAAQRNNLPALEALIKANADVDLRDHNGSTALMHSIQYGNVAFSKRLFGAKCQVNAQAQDGQTAFHCAMVCSPDLCFELIRAGASPAIADGIGLTPLHVLGSLVGSAETNREKIRLLVAAGANLEARNNNGHTPAMFSLFRGNADAFRWFIQEGASPFSIDNRGFNLLHYAASWPDIQLIQYLRSLDLAGINTKHEDFDDDTPWDMFIFTINTPHWQNSFLRPLSQYEKDTFVQLYQEIRDRNLQSHIRSLEQICQGIAQNNKEGVIQILEPLVKQMDDWNQDDLLFNCHDIKTAVLEGNWTVGTEFASKSIADLRAQLQTSPWDQKSWYDEPTDENPDKIEEPEVQVPENSVSGPEELAAYWVE